MHRIRTSQSFYELTLSIWVIIYWDNLRGSDQASKSNKANVSVDETSINGMSLSSGIKLKIRAYWSFCNL